MGVMCFSGRKRWHGIDGSTVSIEATGDFYFVYRRRYRKGVILFQIVRRDDPYMLQENSPALQIRNNRPLCERQYYRFEKRARAWLQKMDIQCH